MAREPSRRSVLVADGGTRALGYIMLRVDEDLGRVYNLKWASVDSLAVDPDYHNQGIGSQLVKEGRILLERKGAEYVEVLAAQNNVPSLVVYERYGFRVVQSDMMLRQYLTVPYSARAVNQREGRMFTVREFLEGDEERMKEMARARGLAPRAMCLDASAIDPRFPKERRNVYIEERVSRWIEIRAKCPSERFILAASEDTLLGYILLRVDKDLSRVYDLEWGSIDMLIVDPRCRLNTIGSFLVQKGLDLFRKKGVKHVEVLTLQNDLETIRTYEESGFRLIQSGVSLGQYLSKKKLNHTTQRRTEWK